MDLEEYLLGHTDPEPDHLKRLYRDANLQLLYPRMLSGHLQGRPLKMLTEMIAPKRALELGTFAGYSALCIAEGLPEGATLDTVEIFDELQPFLENHLSNAPFSDRIRLHIADAMEIVPQLARRDGRFDMAFIDADKRLYPDYYTMLLPLMNPGGWILADNTLWDGKVLEISTGLSDSRHNRQATAIARFNDMVSADNRVEKLILPLRDGLTIIHIKDR